MGLKEGGWVGETTETGGRKGRARGWGWAEWGGDWGGRAAGKGDAGIGDEKGQNPTDGSKRKGTGWLRGVGEAGEGLGVEPSAKARPAGSLRGLKGRTGGGAGTLQPAARSGGAAHSPLCSPRNTSLNFLSGFPKSPPVDMMELEERLPPQPRDPPGPTLLQPADGKGGCRALSAPAGPGGGARLGQDSSSPRGNRRRRRLPAKSPSTERGPRLGREGGRYRKPAVCSGFPRLAPCRSQHPARRLG